MRIISPVMRIVFADERRMIALSHTEFHWTSNSRRPCDAVHGAASLCTHSAAVPVSRQRNVDSSGLRAALARTHRQRTHFAVMYSCARQFQGHHSRSSSSKRSVAPTARAIYVRWVRLGHVVDALGSHWSKLSLECIFAFGQDKLKSI